MLDQHVAVAIGQNVCNLPAPLRGCEDHRVQTLDQYLVAYLAAYLVTKKQPRGHSLWTANIWWALEDLNF